MAQYSRNLIGMPAGGYGTQATRMSALDRMAGTPGMFYAGGNPAFDESSGRTLGGGMQPPRNTVGGMSPLPQPPRAGTPRMFYAGGNPYFSETLGGREPEFRIERPAPIGTLPRRPPITVGGGFGRGTTRPAPTPTPAPRVSEMYNGVLLPQDPRSLPIYIVPGRERRPGGFMGTGADMIREAEYKKQYKDLELARAKAKLGAYKDTSNPYYGYLQREVRRLEEATRGSDDWMSRLREKYKNPDERFYYEIPDAFRQRLAAP